MTTIHHQWPSLQAIASGLERSQKIAQPCFCRISKGFGLPLCHAEARHGSLPFELEQPICMNEGRLTGTTEH